MFIHQGTMKKITFIIIGMLAAAAAYAQAPKDSTVNIIAYWNAGEKYAYEYSAEQYTIVNGDTTEVSYTNSIQIYEILEETESSYKISVTYKDEYSSNPLNNTLNTLLEERYGDPKVIATTDQNGSLLKIDNVQELSDQIVSILDEVVDIMMKNDEGSEIAEEQKAYVRNYLKEMFSNPETVMSIFAEDIGRVLYFHGCGLELDKEYTGQIEVPSIFPGVDQLIPANLTIWADSEYTDEYSTVCRSKTSISAESLRNFLSEYYLHSIKTAGGTELDEEKLQNAIAEVQKAVNEVEGKMNEYLTAEIHATGWPLNVIYDKIVHIIVQGQDQYRSTNWTMSMIIPNSEE